MHLLIVKNSDSLIGSPEGDLPSLPLRGGMARKYAGENYFFCGYVSTQIEPTASTKSA